MCPDETKKSEENVRCVFFFGEEEMLPLELLKKETIVMWNKLNIRWEAWKRNANYAFISVLAIKIEIHTNCDKNDRNTSGIDAPFVSDD